MVAIFAISYYNLYADLSDMAVKQRKNKTGEHLNKSLFCYIFTS